MLQERGDRAFNVLINAFLILAAIITFYPLWYVVIASVSHPSAITLGKVFLWPVEFTLKGYELLLENERIWVGYRNTIFYTAGATALQMVVQISCAFALTRRDLPGRKALNLFFVFTMYFSGGMIPSYLLIYELGWLDNPIVMIVPCAMSVYNMIVARSFFMGSIPESLFDAARIDGCSYIRFFIQVVLPLSGAMLAIIALFNMQVTWNAYLNAQIYLITPAYQTLQQIIQQIVSQATAIGDGASLGGDISAEQMNEMIFRRQLLTYCVIFVASAPMIAIYPFIQKFFVKGIMVGAVKG